MPRPDRVTLLGCLGITCVLFAGAGCAAGDGAPETGQLSAAAQVCASGPTVEGVDVSVYQGNIDWNAVAASGRAFAIARVSDGTGNIDPTFPGNWNGIKAAGMVRGVYQFFRPDEDPIAQADILVNAVGMLGDGDLPPVLDMEVTDGVGAGGIVGAIHAWADRVKAGTGRDPIIYTGKYFWQDNVGNSGDFTNLVLWHAQYTSAACPNIADAWPTWGMWQYADDGQVPGIGGNVDLDRFNGSLADLQQLARAPGCDRHAGPFAWNCAGPLDGMTCTQLLEPSDPDTWADNYFCSARDIGAKWSSTGPIDGMRCTQITEGSEPAGHGWGDNYLCVPPSSPYQFSWSSAGPIDGMNCLQFYEPADPDTWTDNYLCWSNDCQQHQGPFSWSCSGPIDGAACTQILEPADPDTWTDNYFCAQSDIGLQWSYSGPIDGQRCTQITEGSEPAEHTWTDNYLCVPPDSPYTFQWSSAGTIAGMDCIAWYEPADPDTWDDNYLCWTMATPGGSTDGGPSADAGDPGHPGDTGADGGAVGPGDPGPAGNGGPGGRTGSPDGGAGPDGSPAQLGPGPGIGSGCSVASGSTTGSPTTVLLAALALLLVPRRRR
jgi:MYXO-CTERM domain-containing protein